MEMEIRVLGWSVNMDKDKAMDGMHVNGDRLSVLWFLQKSHLLHDEITLR